MAAGERREEQAVALAVPHDLRHEEARHTSDLGQNAVEVGLARVHVLLQVLRVMLAAEGWQRRVPADLGRLRKSFRSSSRRASSVKGLVDFGSGGGMGSGRGCNSSGVVFWEFESVWDCTARRAAALKPSVRLLASLDFFAWSCRGGAELLFSCETGGAITRCGVNTAVGRICSSGRVGIACLIVGRVRRVAQATRCTTGPFLPYMFSSSVEICQNIIVTY